MLLAVLKNMLLRRQRADSMFPYPDRAASELSSSGTPIELRSSCDQRSSDIDIESQNNHHQQQCEIVTEPSALSGGTRQLPKAKAMAPKRRCGGFTVNARVVSDATIGLSDGLTVPFALTAGLAALGDTRVVIFGGLAELIAGAISMGLGGYLGAKSEA